MKIEASWLKCPEKFPELATSKTNMMNCHELSQGVSEGVSTRNMMFDFRGILPRAWPPRPPLCPGNGAEAGRFLDEIDGECLDWTRILLNSKLFDKI